MQRVFKKTRFAWTLDYVVDNYTSFKRRHCFFFAAIWDWVVLSFLFLPFLIVIGDYFSMPKNAKLSYPTTITITVNEICLECQSGIITRSLGDIKRVIDCGDWYYIQFYFPHHKYFACQKDLMVEGTIEAFEEQFKDSIAYKNAEK